MAKKNRNDAVFVKPISSKLDLTKKKSKKSDNIKLENYKSFYKIFAVSVFVIFSFYLIPITSGYFYENINSKKVTENQSKKKFELTLSNKILETDTEKDEGEINLESVFKDIDVFGSDEENSNTSRLSAATIQQLFEDTNYNLKKVKQTKLVNIGNSLDHLPEEMKMIENTSKRKDLFIQIVLPLIIEENTKIRLDRKKLFVILNKNNNTKEDQDWLKSKFKQYGVNSNDLSTLKIRMDEVPVSMALAQAAKETGWGTSRFAQQGNALFGQWTWTGEGIKPAAAQNDTTHKVAKFKVLKASVKAYLRNLNTHSSYKNFRRERAIQRDNQEKLNSLELVKFLDKYAETGIEYTVILKKIIEQNSLTDFDDVKILPTTQKLKNLI